MRLILSSVLAKCTVQTLQFSARSNRNQTSLECTTSRRHGNRRYTRDDLLQHWRNIVLQKKEFVMYSQMSPPNNRGENLHKLLVGLSGFAHNNPVAATVITTDPCSYLSSAWKRNIQHPWHWTGTLIYFLIIWIVTKSYLARLLICLQLKEKKPKQTESTSQQKEYSLEALEEGCQGGINLAEQTFTSTDSMKTYFLCSAYLKQDKTILFLCFVHKSASISFNMGFGQRRSALVIFICLSVRYSLIITRHQ